jgi:ubiquinone/menaquinone biosynthesis C-methylase UbiE
MPSSHDRTIAARVSSLSAKAARYASVPMLVLDSTGSVVEFNVACSVLMGGDLAGCKKRPWSFLAARLNQRVVGTAGHNLPSAVEDRAAGREATSIGDLRPRTAPFRYRTGPFGQADLRVSLLPMIDNESGAPAGSRVEFEILGMEKADRFRQALELRWRHELMWDVYAASYDRLLPELPFYQDVVARHCQAMSAPQIGSVLDMGAGTGSVTLPLLKKGKQVTAVDVASAMLQRLASKLGQDVDAAGRLQVLEDSAEHLPQLADESFDGVTSLLALYDMQDPFAALAEARRLLKPGGTIIVTDPKESFDVERLMVEAERVFRARGIFEQIHEDWTRIQTVKVILDETIRQAREPDEHRALRQPWTAEVLFEALQQNGFRNLEFADSYLGTCATISGLKP